MIVVKIIEHGPSVASTVEQLVTAEAALQLLANQIKANGHEVPQDIQTRLDECTTELKLKLRNDRMRQLRALELRLEQLLSTGEKRRNLEREIESLKNKLT